jgi:hypothetical protein
MEIKTEAAALLFHQLELECEARMVLCPYSHKMLEKETKLRVMIQME